MKKVAVICFENPYNKPSDGAKNDMKTRIMALSRIPDIEIDVYVFNKMEEDDASIDCVKEGIKHFYQFRVQNTGLKAVLGRYPISVFKRYTQECIAELSRHSYDTVIYEGEHMSSYRISNCVKANKHILRQHDIESKYRYELSKSAPSFKFKVGQIYEAWKYKKLEKGIDKYFDSILFISIDEKKEFDSLFPNSKNKFVFMPPSTMRFSEDVCKSTNSNEILYFGNMELQNNVLSILWFAEKVFPLIKEKNKDATLKIIGKISDANKKKLLSLSPAISVLGYVDNLDKAISEATMITSPVLYGAGVKVKVIDALSYGQVVCATSKTIEGTKLEKDVHLIVEDAPAEMAAKCCRVLENRAYYNTMASNGLKFVRKYHSVEYQSNLLKNFI